MSSVERWVLLGASRGLGMAFHEVLKKHRPQDEVLSLSRQSAAVDFAKQEHWPEYVQRMQNFQPTRIVYFAAGGPYGSYEKFAWKDHEWAFKVSFLFPAYLIREVLHSKAKDLKQLTFIGSSVAENQPDPGAAAYCASKHALRALIETIHLEQQSNGSSRAASAEDKVSPLQIKLFSPGYMNTALLPLGSWPREQGLAVDPHLEALKLYDEVFAD